MDLAFFLKVIRSRGHQYAYLARSLRQGPRVTTEILVRFGVVTDEQLARLRKWLATDPTLPPQPQALLTDLSQLRLREAWEYGCYCGNQWLPTIGEPADNPVSFLAVTRASSLT